MKKYYWKIRSGNIIHEKEIVSSSFKNAEKLLIIFCNNEEHIPLEYLGWEKVEEKDYEKKDLL